MLVAKSRLQALIGLLFVGLGFVFDKIVKPAVKYRVLGFSMSWISQIMTLIISLLPLLIVIYLIKLMKKQLGG